MHGAFTCDLLVHHLVEDHFVDELSFEQGDLLYLINAHEAVHREEEGRS